MTEEPRCGDAPGTPACTRVEQDRDDARGHDCNRHVPSGVVRRDGHQGTQRSMQCALVAALILPILFYAGTRWGTGGVAAAWLLGHPIIVMPMFLAYALRITRLRLAEYLRALLPATGATLLMAAAVLGVRFASPH